MAAGPWQLLRRRVAVPTGMETASGHECACGGVLCCHMGCLTWDESLGLAGLSMAGVEGAKEQ